MADEASDLPGLPAETVHCRLEEVVAYRAGDLPSEQAAAFEDHLRRCPACLRLVTDAANVLTQVDATLRAARQAAQAKVNQVDLILARLRRKVAERAARPAGWTPRQPSQRFWLPAAGVAAVVVLVAALQLLMALLPSLWRK
jgi:anti-sigma factor ChrR (cupin superfamily)